MREEEKERKKDISQKTEAKKKEEKGKKRRQKKQTGTLQTRTDSTYLLPRDSGLPSASCLLGVSQQGKIITQT